MRLVFLLAVLIPWSSLHPTHVREMDRGQAGWATASAMVVDYARHAWINQNTPLADNPTHAQCVHDQAIYLIRVKGGLAVSELDWEQIKWGRTRTPYPRRGWLQVMSFSQNAPQGCS